MTRIIQTLDEVAPAYSVLYCDLWGCLHDGRQVFPDAVAALERFRKRGGLVVLMTNSPRPSDGVAHQIDALGAPRGCWDLIVSSGDAAQVALANGSFGKKVYHIGPERDAAFFRDAQGRALDIERTQLDAAAGIVCTGLFDDQTETPEDYRAILLEARHRGLKMLCANPDVIVDVGDRRLFCAGAIAQAYEAEGGSVYYFGKPHPPIYALARRRLAQEFDCEVEDADILCIGDGIATDIAGAVGESLDSIFITGGLAAAETATSETGGPNPERLAALVAKHRISPGMALSFLR